MKVRVCPKCGAENNETRESCSNCYASLAGVEPTESTREPVTIPTGTGRPPRQPRREPQTSPSSEPVRAEGAVNEDLGAGVPGRSPFFYREPPPVVKQGSKVGLIVLALVVLAGAGFGGWYFVLRHPSPAQVVQSFIDACEAQDAEKAKSFLSKTTLQAPGVAEGFTKGFATARKLAREQGSQKSSGSMKILGTSYEGSSKDTAVVASQPLDERGQPASGGMTVNWVLVKEEGVWKIDLVQTIQRVFAEAFRQMSTKQRANQTPSLPSQPHKP
ncbi:MAG: zinc ribbon domain-containing protein [Armatimonadota bacterium]|nr:zinc ribbon domain-containing protein [Armatimonadota bacterium]